RLRRETTSGDRSCTRHITLAAAARRTARRHEPPGARRDRPAPEEYSARAHACRGGARYGCSVRVGRAHHRAARRGGAGRGRAIGDPAQQSCAGSLSGRRCSGMSSLLEVDRINSYYGDSHILFDVSLDVNKNEVVALLGRNGAGKTTTLNTLIGFV